MLNFKRWSLLTAAILLVVLVLSACGTPTPETITIVETQIATVVVTVEGQSEPVIQTVVVTQEVVVTVEPTPMPTEPPAPKDLIICMAQEPATLYVYGGSMLAQSAVAHAFTSNLITNISFGYQAGEGLEKLPTIDDGDAVINSVEVNAGDMVVDVTGEVVALADGVVVKNSAGEEVTFAGTPVMMDQMVVTFKLKQMYWSDGEPVTADDSVYSYEVGKDPDTPSSKYTYDRTASYEAADDLTTVWTGVPGFRDSTYFTNVWGPLPRHYTGHLTAAQLLEAEESSRKPLSYGAFQILEWTPGESIYLEPNPYYFRSDEGLPYLSSVTYKFIADTNALVAQLLAGTCDIGTQDGMDVGQSPFLINAEEQGLLVPYFQTGTVYEHIDFNIDPLDGVSRGGDRLEWFRDARVRQAMTMCTDRQGMVDNILYGRSEVIHTYVPSVHPMYPAEGLTEWAFDPEAGNALLDEVGYMDTNGDGIREDADGNPFHITLGTTSGNEMRQQLTQIFQENMAGCGIEVELYYQPAGEWFADGPEGVLFGRRFDLGEFAWLTGVEPACNLYLTSAIPGDPADGWAGWGGSNETGWSNEEFDLACNGALGSLPGTADYEEYHKAAQVVFSQEVPVIPLFLRLKVAAARPEILNFGVDPTQNSELWNISEIDIQQ